MTDQTSNLPAKDEIQNILDEAQKDVGFQKLLKFVKGHYICNKDEVPRSTKYLAHARGWAKTWVKFVDKKVVDRKTYRIFRGERVPDRDELGDQDQSRWEIGINRMPADPWVLQYLLPMENVETDEVQIFVTSSRGGQIAVGTLCTEFAKRAKQQNKDSQPFVILQTQLMSTKNFGDVIRPHFEVIGWDDPSHGVTAREPVREVSAEALKKGEMDDEIPF